MSQPQVAIPPDLLELSQRLERWRSEQPPRTRLPESIWTAAVEMAQRYGLHRTTKLLRMDYTRLKRLMPAVAQTAGPAPSWNCCEFFGLPALNAVMSDSP